MTGAGETGGERPGASGVRAALDGAAWRAAGPPPIVVPETPRLARAWRTRAAIVVVVAAAAWRALASLGADAPAGAAPPWELELAAAGDRGAPVLVFGQGTGVHLMRVRPAGVGRRVTLPAPVAEGNVWMISLGGAPLVVRGRGGAGSPVASFGATGRVVEAFQRPSGAGVRTW